jgi:hypothetical protein
VQPLTVQGKELRVRLLRTSTLSLLSIALVIASSGFGSGADSGPVLAIDIEVSPIPDLTSIDSVYTGDTRGFYAFLVVRDMPGGFVKAYHLAVDLVSQDSTVFILGFRTMPGWRQLDPFEGDFPNHSHLPGAPTPAIIGYWKLLLTRGAESTGELRLKPPRGANEEQIVLIDSDGNVAASPVVFSAWINPDPDRRGGDCLL